MWSVNGFEVYLISEYGQLRYDNTNFYGEAVYRVSPNTKFNIIIHDTTPNNNVYFGILHQCYDKNKYHGGIAVIQDDELVYRDEAKIELGLVRYIKLPSGMKKQLLHHYVETPEGIDKANKFKRIGLLSDIIIHLKNEI
jgi:hypothetical protein